VKLKHQDTLRYYWPARRFVWRVRCGLGWLICKTEKRRTA